MSKKSVSCADAQAVLAEVVRVFDVAQWGPGHQPVLLDHNEQPGSWRIVWEEGPYEWALRFPHGGLDEERTEMLSDYAQGGRFVTPEARVPAGVWVETQNSYAVSVWPR